MSNIAPEGAPHPIADAPPAPAAPAPVVPTPKQITEFFAPKPTGIQTAHVAGGGAGSIIGAVVVAVCNHFHVHVSDVDATIIGSAALSAGVGLGHVFAAVGVFPAIKKFFTGKA